MLKPGSKRVKPGIGSTSHFTLICCCFCSCCCCLSSSTNISTRACACVLSSGSGVCVSSVRRCRLSESRRRSLVDDGKNVCACRPGQRHTEREAGPVAVSGCFFFFYHPQIHGPVTLKLSWTSVETSPLLPLAPQEQR